MVLFATQSMDPGVPRAYRAFEASGQVRGFYLTEQVEQGSLAFEILGMLRTPKRKFKAKIEEMLSKVRAEPLSADQQQQIMGMFATVLAAKFPELSRREIEAMLRTKSLRNSRAFQETLQEGREEGREEKKREMISRMAALQMPIAQIAEVAQLSVEQVQAILDSRLPE